MNDFNAHPLKNQFALKGLAFSFAPMNAKNQGNFDVREFQEVFGDVDSKLVEEAGGNIIRHSFRRSLGQRQSRLWEKFQYHKMLKQMVKLYLYCGTTAVRNSYLYVH